MASCKSPIHKLQTPYYKVVGPIPFENARSNLHSTTRMLRPLVKQNFGSMSAWFSKYTTQVQHQSYLCMYPENNGTSTETLSNTRLAWAIEYKMDNCILKLSELDNSRIVYDKVRMYITRTTKLVEDPIRRVKDYRTYVVHNSQTGLSFTNACKWIEKVDNERFTTNEIFKYKIFYK